VILETAIGLLRIGSPDESEKKSSRILDDKTPKMT